MLVTRRHLLPACLILPFLAVLSYAAPPTQGDPPQLALVPSQTASGYPVTGRMVCADTQRAARFAQVTLLPAGQDSGRRLSARTDLDGNFLVPNVPAGDYFVTGSLPGYVNLSSAIQNAVNSGSDPASLGAPLVHVAAGGASAVLSLQRGGVLAGTVQWDDGTPAAGVSVSAQPVTASNSTGAAQLSQGGRGFGNGNVFGGNFAGAQTDDRGRFRLSGLAPGSYYVRANVQAPAPQRPDDRGFSRTLSLSIYAPDKVRRTDATPVTVAAGEERADLNLVMGLAAMHTVSGTVSSSAASVRSGTVSVTDQTDGTLSRNGVISSDGSFVIPYVPAGTYTLRVAASSQMTTSGRGGGGGTSSTDASARFQPLTESLTVSDSDLTGLSVTVTAGTGSQ